MRRDLKLWKKNVNFGCANGLCMYLKFRKVLLDAQMMKDVCSFSNLSYAGAWGSVRCYISSTLLKQAR